MLETQLRLHGAYMDARPKVNRSRSHTDPSKPGTPSTPTEPQTAAPDVAPTTTTRPSHGRSHSYLSPAETKPRNAVSLPVPAGVVEKRTADKLPRLHLPGSSYRHHQRNAHSHHQQSSSHSTHRSDNGGAGAGGGSRHRQTQSDAHAPTPSSRRVPSKETMTSGGGGGLPHLVAGLNAEREREKRSSQHTAAAGTNQTRSAQHTSPSAAAQTADHDPNAGLRAVSEPSSRPPARPKTSFERALERGDQARVARRIHVKKEDLVKRDAELAAAEEELRERVTAITAKGVEITRRLDYGYYNLLETLGNLVATITSFQSLGAQSGQLIANFDRETDRLDGETKTREANFRSGFEARGDKAGRLAERGQRAIDKAEDLGRRLENARVVVENWERREDQVRQVWNRVWRIVWWTSISILVSVLVVILGKEWWFRGDPVKAGLRVPGEGSWNRSLRLGGAEGTVAGDNEEVLEHLPSDVRRLLRDIADRNRHRKVVFPAIPKEILGGGDVEAVEDKFPPRSKPTDQIKSILGFDVQAEEDPRLRRLDEL